jgi:AcrR family transcriptional regulator
LNTGSSAGRRIVEERWVPNPETEARIREAAIVLFAEHGFSTTTVRQVAERAEVSAGLVIHYFGSKDGLRAACDRRVAELVRAGKENAAAQGPGLDPLAAMRDAAEGPPLLRYMARALAERSPGVHDLFDQLVADAVTYSQVMVDTGIIKPTEHHEGRAVVLVAWSLGALVLHEHIERILGVDMLTFPDGPASGMAYFAPMLEMLSGGLLEPEVAERYRQAFLDGAADDQQPTQPTHQEGNHDHD